MPKQQIAAPKSLVDRLVSKIQNTAANFDEEHQSLRREHQQKKADKKAVRQWKRDHRLGRPNKFAQLFAALPAEIKSIIIAEVVRSADEVEFSRLRPSRWKLGMPFWRDRKLEAEAKFQHARINTFFLPPHAAHLSPRWQPFSLGPTLRHLSLRLTIDVEGCDLSKGVGISAKEGRLVNAVPELFPCLESFVCDVRNIVEEYGKHAFFHYAGNAPYLHARSFHIGRLYERRSKAEMIITLVRDLTFPRWRKDLKFSKKVILTQKLFDVSRAGDVLKVVDPGRPTDDADFTLTDKAEFRVYVKLLNSIMDAPRAEVVFKGAQLALTPS